MEPRYLLDTNICIYIRQKFCADSGSSVQEKLCFRSSLMESCSMGQLRASNGLPRLSDCVSSSICYLQCPCRTQRPKPMERFAPSWNRRAR